MKTKTSFEKSVDTHTTTKTTERLTIVINGWEVLVHHEQGDAYRIHVSEAWDCNKSYKDRNRCSISSLMPRSVDELEAFAKAIGPVLSELADALRREGITDMRDDDDRRDDE